MSSDFLQDDPYGYNSLPIYGVAVHPDDSETSSAAHPRLEGMDAGELYVVATPDAIFGPYATFNAAQSLLEDGSVNPDESLVMQLTYP